MRNLNKPIDVVLLKEATQFYDTLSVKAQIKLLKSFDKTKEGFKGNWFKNLRDGIWVFKIKDQNQFIRVLAFWDKSKEIETLIVATHGFNKKTNKAPNSQIEKAIKLKKQYFKLDN